MTLKDLFNIHGHLEWRQQDPTHSPGSLHSDSRKITSGDVFVAYCGHQSDGHQFINAAIQQGASALVVEDRALVPSDYGGAVMEVLDGRLALQRLSQIFYGSPGEELLGIAVTGTNGKTSTTYILEHLLHGLGYPCGVIGTIDHHVGEQKWKTGLTTPDPITLQERLQDFKNAGAKAFVIEASSHALHQNRIHQGFDGVIFTNLSRDHLDYHRDMDDYFMAKAKLFGQEMLKEGRDGFAIINGDDPFGKKLPETTVGRRIFLFGESSENNIVFAIQMQSLEGVTFSLQFPDGGQFQVHSPLIGKYNVQNVVGCLATVYALGLNLQKACEVMRRFPGVPGRLQAATSQDRIFGFVDYAHTPEALEKAILALKGLKSPNAKIITVFGCGGDRDKGKRPLMGEVASRLSDSIVVTSDNPRTEDPEAIIDEIFQGINKTKNTLRQENREQAIAEAVKIANPGDVVLIAGKGHEDYQIIGKDIKPFDDFKTLQHHFNKTENT